MENEETKTTEVKEETTTTEVKEDTKKKEKKAKKGKLPIIPIVICVTVLVCVIVGAILVSSSNKGSQPTVITVPTLEKIINVSELSTFTAVYNGIAVVNNEKKPEKVEYYVSYEARVNAGIDFEKIDIAVDNETKKIVIRIPEVYITDINVDITTLDFIFINDKANASTVTAQAFKACEDDVRAESEQQSAIYELAKQNAINILTALTKPIVEQLDAEYELIIE